MPEEVWPKLEWADWRYTCVTLQLWTQVIGKIRMGLTPPLNQCWNVTLYVTCRGLTTAPMPYGWKMLQIDMDFVDHLLVFQSTDGSREVVKLRPMSVATFYGEVMERLKSLGVAVHLWATPCEVADPIPFEKDETHHSYDAEYAWRFWQTLVQVDRVFGKFRARFTGKFSPIHYFWGAMDVAVTRFSGRKAPVHPSTPGLPDRVVRDAYSHEVSSAGFWPGGGGVDYAAFYSYAYPEPAGFRITRARPEAAFFSEALGEFILPYDAVRTAAAPEQALLDFLQSTYEAAAIAAKWDRDALECVLGQPGVVRQI